MLEVVADIPAILPTLEAMPLVEAIPLAEQAPCRALLLHMVLTVSLLALMVALTTVLQVHWWSWSLLCVVQQLRHTMEHCRRIDEAVAQKSGCQQVSTFLDAYCSANDISIGGSQYVHDAVFASMDMSDMLANYGTSQPQRIIQHMLDMAAVYIGTPVNLFPAGMANALSSSGPKLMFNAELAVSFSKPFQARALVDMGALHSYISQSYLATTKLPVSASLFRREL